MRSRLIKTEVEKRRNSLSERSLGSVSECRKSRRSRPCFCFEWWLASGVVLACSTSGGQAPQLPKFDCNVSPSWCHHHPTGFHRVSCAFASGLSALKARALLRVPVLMFAARLPLHLFTEPALLDPLPPLSFLPSLGLILDLQSSLGFSVFYPLLFLLL